VITAVIEQPAPPPPVHAGPLRGLLDRLLTKDPDQRDDAETVARELAGLRSGPATGGPYPMNAPAGGSGPTAVLGSNGGQATHTYVAAPAASGQPASGLGAGPAAAGPGGGQGGRAPAPAGRPPSRRRHLAGGAAALALIVALSAGLYLATKPHSPGKPAASGGSSPASHAATGSPATGGPSGTTATTASTSPKCATGSLQVYGSSAFQGIARGAAAAYMSACPNSAIDVNKGITGQDSAFGVTKAEQAVESHSPAAGSTIAMYDGTTTIGPQLVAHSVGVLIYAVVAHKGLFPGSKVTSGQLVNIFVNHGDPSVLVVGRKPGSATHLTFFTKILHARQGPTDVNENDSASVIAFVGTTKNAIGYAVALQYNPRVSLLSIGNAAPSKTNVLSGSYQFWATEHFYTAPQPTALATDFLDFLPRYIQSHPQGDFIACADATQVAGAGCYR
jgi:ABC-type phosphate transport system substrate-binding protein